MPRAQHYQVVDVYPGEDKSRRARCVDGAIVCCGIFGVFEHTGILVDGHVIELAGTGLVRGLSLERFLANRSGDQIYCACDSQAHALTHIGVADTAVQQLYTFRNYDVVSNNCNRFVADCITGENRPITTFYELNQVIFTAFHSRVSWLPMV